MAARLPTDDEWFSILDSEEAEFFAADFVEGIIQRAQDVLFEKHIESQVLPYAVGFSKETILSVIDWRFLSRDEGVFDEQSWIPDEEPTPSPTDAWARGTVPIRKTVGSAVVRSSSGMPAQAVQSTAVGKAALSGVNDGKEGASSRGRLTVKDANQQHHVGTAATSDGNHGARSGSNREGGLGKSQHTKESAGGENKKDRIIHMQAAVDEKLAAMVSRPNSVQDFIAAPPSPPKRLAAPRPLVSKAAKDSSYLATHTDQLDSIIREENKKTLEKIAKIEKDGTKAIYTYDADGRILLLKTQSPNKLLVQTVKAKIHANMFRETIAGPSGQSGALPPLSTFPEIRNNSVSLKKKA